MGVGLYGHALSDSGTSPTHAARAVTPTPKKGADLFLQLDGDLAKDFSMAVAADFLTPRAVVEGEDALAVPVWKIRLDKHWLVPVWQESPVSLALARSTVFEVGMLRALTVAL